MTAPVAPGALPILGHALPLLRDPLAFLRSLPAHGPVVRIRIGPAKAHVICDAELTRQVLLRDRDFDKGGPLYDSALDVAGDNMVTTSHTDHRRQRRTVQPAFRLARLDAYIRAIVDEAVAFTRGWHDGDTIDPTSGLSGLFTRSHLLTMVGASSLSRAALAEAVHDVSDIADGIFRRMLLPVPLRRLPIPANRRFDRASHRLRGTIAQLIADRGAGGHRGDVLSALLEPGGPTEDELVTQLLALFLAGTETVANALSWTLHHLARRPDLQERLHTELAPLDPQVLGVEDLPRLALTRAVLLESLRLHPPLWFLTRTTRADTELGRFRIPGGSTVVYSPYLIHHHEDLHPDPERFIPDRWTGTTVRANGILIPFSSGPRKCLGEHFAMLESTVLLAVLIRSWRLDPAGNPRMPRAITSSNLKPKNRPLLRVTARS